MNNVNFETVATLTLPWPPSVNAAFNPNPNGRGMILSSDARKFKKRVKNSILTGGQMFAGPVWIELALHPPHRRGDIDNYIKATVDAIKDAKIIKSDNMTCVVGHIAFLAEVDPANPRIIATVHRQIDRA